MYNILTNIHIKVNEKLYLKDPESSELGKKILHHGVSMIHKLGFEHFTFQKLAKQIKTTEASIYRYFESKAKLLLYLTNWYWAWMEYRLTFETANIMSAKKRLEISIQILTEEKQELKSDLFDFSKLHQLVMIESSKSFLLKEVDQINKEGAYLNLKKVVAFLSGMIKELNPHYKYPQMLVSTIIEGIHQQRFFADHLPRLTNSIKGEDSIAKFYKELLFKSIEK
jgi:AcrR family transcriptional regulator